jgi:organic radical activating enzyme
MNPPIYHITELFESIQGEGNRVGVNSLFVRFHYCNLTCSWCDTKYTWSIQSAHKTYDKSQLKSLLQNTQANNVIFTGGEPTLYQIDDLVIPSKHFHVETNGVLIPTDPLSMTLNDGSHWERRAMEESIIKDFNWVVSPKLSNSGEKISEKSLRYWAEKEWCIFKFVVKNSMDINEVENLAEKFNLRKEKIYIGLEGITIDSQLRPELVDEIIQRGYNYSPRIHILLWGKEREK